MKIVQRIHNIETGEIIDTEREATSEELIQYEKNQLKAAELAAKEIEISRAKAALLDRLGITEEEARLLLS